jgi:hypothetical protein
VIGFGFGLPLISGGGASMSAHDWEMFYSFFIAGQFNYWASLLVASGWVGSRSRSGTSASRVA